MTKKPRHILTTNGEYRITDYNQAEPFANMFPGIAGLWGTPLWLFWMNRGQAVATFGAANKDGAIVEFNGAANHARRLGTEGFRTFLKLKGPDETQVNHECFQINAPESCQQTLTHDASSLWLTETSEELGLHVEVRYYPLPNEDFPALVRVLRITNRGSTPLDVESLDGLPLMVPHGINHFVLKNMICISDANSLVRNVENHIPFFGVKALPSDDSESNFPEAGNFYMTLNSTSGDLCPMVVDASTIFGPQRDLAIPQAFYETPQFKIPHPQETVCQTPCAFSHATFQLAPGQTQEFHSLIGKAENIEALPSIRERFQKASAFKCKEKENQQEIDRVGSLLHFVTGQPRFDQFVAQTHLDNTLRGGLPLTLKGDDKRFVFHVYSRKHGDIEREYNLFQLDPCFLSQGNGNFRDVNQNRRNDIWLNPLVGENTLLLFWNALQLDGFNPLHYQGSRFQVTERPAAYSSLIEITDEKSTELLLDFLCAPFSPGALFTFLRDHHISIDLPHAEILSRILAHCEKSEEFEFEVGYWLDHWMYNIDLLESYLAIYPDRLEGLLLDHSKFLYYDPLVSVWPRSKKYKLNDKGELRLKRAPMSEIPGKKDLMAERTERRHAVRNQQGRGSIHHCGLIEKMLCLIVNKMASVSPSGMGIEMDGGRPGWCDSVNGLPALFGAGMPEAYQLRYLIRTLQGWLCLPALRDYSHEFPEEIYDFISELSEILNTWKNAPNEETRDFICWDEANTLKEAYRLQISLGLSGVLKKISTKEVTVFLERAALRLDTGNQRAQHPSSGLPLTYVTHQACLDTTNDTGDFKITGFHEHRFAPFLEGPAYAMKTGTTLAAKTLHQKIETSSLYDEGQKMFKCNYGLENETPEQGRTHSFAKGWLENESIFVHMHYKYVLALLKSGLHAEFYKAFEDGLPIHRDPSVYGRSPLENGSFIPPAGHGRQSNIGRVFQARLTGANAELVSIFLILAFGPKPFRMVDNELVLAFEPLLKGDAFTQRVTTRQIERFDAPALHLEIPENAVAMSFLGNTTVVYHNPHRGDTFGEHAVSPQRLELTYHKENFKEEISSGQLRGDLALAVREGKVAQIDVYLN
ncbi:hypothetical protein P3T73_01940 [Kiritimatiellota bacterium B12222]|nr:hypothetical protein P3T73_01940 [Kiritimatiellota bacterium B12222]